MPNCKVGDLCVILKGPHAGKCVTILAAATGHDVQLAICKQLNMRYVGDYSEFQKVWHVDFDVTWTSNLTDGARLNSRIPYEVDSKLMPITPPATMTDKATDKELTV